MMTKEKSKLIDKPNSLTETMINLLSSPEARSFRDKKHLVETDQLTTEEIENIFALAKVYKKQRDEKLFPLHLLSQEHVALTFYENSTRTKSSFSIATANLGANPVNLDISTSSVAKGESLEDTARTLISMGVRAIVQRHSENDAASELAHCLGRAASVINAGSGKESHPTQALLDCFTMLETEKSLKGKRIAIVGDTKYSRVARSNVKLLSRMGAEIIICSPPELAATDLLELTWGLENDLKTAVRDCDFIMALRIQNERLEKDLKIDQKKYIESYQINHDILKLAGKNVKVLHPGPVNRDLELSSKVMDDKERSLIEKQVANGIFIRMAVLSLLLHS